MININNVQFSYQDNQPVLKNVDLTIKKGALFGLLGPNGAGKSTLISLIAGLHVPQQGSISVSDMTYSASRTKIQEKLAVVPQDYAFYLHLTVMENIEYFASLYRKQNDQVEKALELTGLFDHKLKLANQLSGGLKRRLNLAIGLLNEPEILILDEPTVGIDPQSRYFILQAIKNINANGTTVIYTSHYMEEVEQLCDVIAIMDHGRILKQGSLEQLLESDRHLEIDIEGIEKTQPIKDVIVSFGLEIDEDSLKGELAADKSLIALLGLLDENNISVVKIRYGKQSLESLFFSLTHSALRE